MENNQEKGKGVPMLVRAIRLFYKGSQHEQTTTETAHPEAVEPALPTLEKQMGDYLNRRTAHFTAVQKKSLVLAVLLLLASSFVFLFSRGFSSSRKPQIEKSMPAMKTDTASTTSKLRLTP